MKKELNLSPDSFKVNEKGEVVINNANLVETLKVSEESAIGEQGIKVTVSFEF